MPTKNLPKLTYLITGLQFGGANTGMARLLSELESDEFDITVVAIAKTPPDVVSMLPDHVDVLHLQIEGISGIPKLRHLIGRLRVTDILVCSLFHATAIGVPLGLLFRVPQILVWQHTTSYQTAFRARSYQFAYAAADRVLADSEAVRSMLVDSIGVPDEKVSTLPIAGINMSQFRAITEKNPNKDKIVVSTVGRLNEIKGYDNLIQTAELLPDKFRFNIAGDGERYEELVSGSPNNVHFAGTISNEDIPQFLNKSDIYFQPSKREGLCMTVIEAMACELPIVASNVGGITESVVNGETGFLCEPGDISCYVHKIDKLASEPSLRDEMGSAGRERVIAHYSQRELADQFRNAVEEVK